MPILLHPRMPQDGAGPVTTLPVNETRLIVNADDFGICPQVNAGIIAAHRAGIVTSASLMAAGPAFEEAVRWCRVCPALDIGAHLTLVGAIPLIQGPSSLSRPDGRFVEGLGPFMRRWLTGRIRRADIRREWCAQIERILQRGIRLTHLDSHQHLHALPGIRDLAFELAEIYGIAFVRKPAEALCMDRPLRGGSLLRLLQLTALRASWTAACLARQAHQRSAATVRFMGFCDGGHLDHRRLMRLVRRMEKGGIYELMCHPGFAPQEPRIQRWNYHHEAELAALTSPQVRSAIEALGIRLVGFKDLLHP